jgi:Amt family ammonium transporter
MILFVFGISIVIGATAERLRFWPLILFSILMLLVVYPMEAFWVWGGGFLQKLEFIDQGGASVIHLNSAMLALAGLTILGHRNGKYDRMNESLPLPGANIPLSTLGVALLWVGFIGLNLLAVLFADKNFAVNQVYIVVFNTLLAGSVGLLSSIFFSRVIFGTIDLTLVFNGLLASLVMFTAQPAMSSHAHVIIAAMIATILTMVLLFILDKLRIDDPIGVIASQTAGSLVGLVAVAFDAENLARQVGIQLMGAVSIIIYSFAVGYLLWWLVRLTMGLRIKPEDEYKGLDVTGCGMVAYPEFTSTNWEK